MMIKVRLETANGEFVCLAVMAPFTVLPKAVMWGSRMFQHREDDAQIGLPVYREVFCVVVFDEKTYAELTRAGS